MAASTAAASAEKSQSVNCTDANFQVNLPRRRCRARPWRDFRRPRDACRSGIRRAECINTLLRTIYPGAASSILTACMMFPARFVRLQLLPSQYLLPDASCASDLHLCIFAQGGSRTLSLLQLRSIALALSMWACVVRALLVCHGRTLTLGRRYVVLHAVWRFCVFIRMLACDMHTQGVPRME